MSYIHYKDYIGNVELCEKDALLYGKVVGIKESITFNGDSVTAVTDDFHHAIDEYLAHCAETGKPPEKPFKGSFNVRIAPELHRQAALAASALGISLNAYVEDAIKNNLSRNGDADI